MALNAAHWRGRRVLVTGHTGFKGAWLCLWLNELGARTTGFSLPPPTRPSLFELAGVNACLSHVEGDVRDAASLHEAFRAAEPELVLHLAAQSLVRRSYRDPVETYQTNVLGTINVLEQCRSTTSVRAVLIVTSDKCYESRPPYAPHGESDALGGDDPYSSSKACAELAAASYRRAFFAAATAPCVATARAGNVIGGGDFAEERLVPDVVRAAAKGERVVIRNSGAVRPWQHVLEPLAGYLALCERLSAGQRDCAEAWNFGPAAEDAKPVAWVVQRTLQLLGRPQEWLDQPDHRMPELETLMLDSGKARSRLGWQPRLRVDEALEWTAQWHRACQKGGDPKMVTLDQIKRYCAPG
jgi:CDP-glucose 4,6-dehydratase